MTAITQSITLSYIEEVTEGVIPSNPTFQKLPITSVEVDEEVSTEEIYELNERSPSGVTNAHSDVRGFIGFELTYVAWKPFLIEVLRNGNSSYEDFNFGSVLVSVESGPDRFEANGALNFTNEGLSVGQYIKVEGFTESNNNGVFKIIAMPSSTRIDVVGKEPLITEAQGDSITITVYRFADAKVTGKTYTFRKYYEEDGNPFYEYYTGCKIDKIFLNLRLSEIVSGIMHIAGTGKQTGVVSGESIVDYSFPALMSTVLNVEHVDISTSVDPARIYTELNIEFNNQCKSRFEAGVLSAGSILDGYLNAMVNGQMYFEDLDVYNKFVGETEFAFGLCMSDGSNTIAIAMNRCRLRSITKPVPGKNTFLLEKFALTSLLDANGFTTYFNFF